MVKLNQGKNRAAFGVALLFASIALAVPALIMRLSRYQAPEYKARPTDQLIQQGALYNSLYQQQFAGRIDGAPVLTGPE